MNSQKVQELINQEIAKLHKEIGGKAARKQYAPAKHQIAKLAELGIIDLMPKGFGHSDAGAVIKAATAEWTAVFNAAGEGEEIPAAGLATAIKEVEIVEVVQPVLSKGQSIRVLPHTSYSDLRVGAIVTPPFEHELVHGFETTIRDIFQEKMEDEHGNEVVETIIETAAGELFSPDQIEVL